MKDIFLVRHGRQCSKLCNVDVSLDESGRKQAELAGKRLISYQLEKLYCSQLIFGRHRRNPFWWIYRQNR